MVRPISETAYGENGWLGTLPNTPWVGMYVDLAFQMILGGMPWQVGLYISCKIKIAGVKNVFNIMVKLIEKINQFYL